MSGSDQSRKVLEEIQKAKTTLLKQGSVGSVSVGGSIPIGGLIHSITPQAPVISNHFSLLTNLDVHNSPAQRQAQVILQQANASSFGSFIATESHFGNSILPVLPRLQELREIENYLSQCETFSNPKIELEQYHTSAHIAARMLYAAQDKIQGASVCDLGSGCGVLSIGSVICGANYVVGIEIDTDAIDIALLNREEILDTDTTLEFIQIPVHSLSYHFSRFDQFFDVIISNPPFGTKQNSVGADFEFLKCGIKLLKPGGQIYSLHKTSTRSFFEKKLQELGLNGRVLAQVHFDLPKTYKFHKEKSKDIQVDFWNFQKK